MQNGNLILTNEYDAADRVIRQTLCLTDALTRLSTGWIMPVKWLRRTRGIPRSHMEDKHEWRSAIHFEADSKPVNKHVHQQHSQQGSTQKQQSLCYSPPGLQLRVKVGLMTTSLRPMSLGELLDRSFFPVPKAFCALRRNHCGAPSCAACLPTHWGCIGRGTTTAFTAMGLVWLFATMVLYLGASAASQGATVVRFQGSSGN